jgi:hypothetical protein
MKFLFILFWVFFILSIVSIIIYIQTDISKYAWGYRIRKVVYKNGEIEYFIQQRVPFVLIWMNCSYMIGYEMYTYRCYEDEKNAKEFLKKFRESLEREKGYRVKSEQTIKEK